MTIRVLLIGDVNRAEMRPLRDWVQRRTTAHSLRQSASVAEALGHFSPAWQPDLIIALESQPDDYTPDEVSALFAAGPISRIVCCAGVWSESAGRTRKIWPVALRIAAVSAISRLEREWELLSNSFTGCPLPPTGSREEWFAVHHRAIARSSALIDRNIAVISPDPAYRAFLVDLVTLAGGLVCTDQPVDTLLWDADPWSAQRAMELHQQRLATPGVPVVIVSGWVTPELVSEWTSLKVDAVVPKLGDAHVLLETLAATVIPAIRVPD